MTKKTGKLARWLLGQSEFKFDVVHPANIMHQAADALSRSPRRGNHDTSLNGELPFFTIPGNTTPDNRSSFFTITDGRYSPRKCWSNDVFTMRWKDNGITDRTNYNHIPALSEKLRFAESPDFYPLATIADSITNQANGANFNQKNYWSVSWIPSICTTVIGTSFDRRKRPCSTKRYNRCTSRSEIISVASSRSGWSPQRTTCI